MSKYLSVFRKALWGGLLMGFICPLAASATSPGSEQNIDWTRSSFSGTAHPDALSPTELKTYLEDRRYVRGLVEPDVATSLDYSDPRVFRFVLARLKQAGKTPRTAPRLFELINQRRAAQLRDPSTVEVVASANGLKNQHFMNSSNFLSESSPFMEANAIVTHPGGAIYLYVDSAAWDNNGTPLGAMGYGEKYGGAIARSAAIGDITQTSALDYEVDSYSLTDSPAGLRESYSVRANNRKCQFDLATLVINDPVNKTGGQCVDLCLNRTWTGDCDYDLTGTPQALKVPLSGSIGISANNPNCVFDANRIAQYQNGTINPPPGNIKVVLSNVGGGCDVDSNNALYTPMQNFWNHVTLSADEKTLTWNLTGADAAEFDSSCRQVQDQLELTMILNLPLKQGAVELPPRPVVVSNDPDSQATDYQLPCMTMTNSCLAEGTKIQLADGRAVPIESIQIGDKTFNPYHPDTTALTVVDTAKGFENVPMVRIKDPIGRSLLMTEMHPIATVDRGMVQARKLRVGDRVQTRTGPSQLVSVTRELFSGKVYNLKVGSDAESLRLGPDQTVVYAGDFVVGDGQIQQKYESAEQNASAKSDVRKRLPKRWHRDYVKSATR